MKRSGLCYGALVVAVVWLVCGLVTAGCRSEPDTEASSKVRSVSQAITGTASVAITLPHGVFLDEVAVAASDQVRISDRSRIEAPPDSGAKLSNVGGGNVYVGTQATVIGVTSIGSVTLQQNATVDGDILTAGSVSEQSAVTVTGSVVEQATLTPTASVAREVTFPGGETIHRPPYSEPLALAPGGYGDISIHTGSVLRLAPGSYHFESIALEPEAVLELEPGGPYLIYVRGTFNMKGNFVYPGSPADVFFGLLGTGTISLERALSGTIVAPNATLRFAPAHKEFQGSFFAQSIQVEPDLTLSYVPFAHWGRVFPAIPKADCISVQNSVVRAARFSYENHLDTVTTIPRGARNQVTPTPPSGFEPPEDFLPGEHFYWTSFEGDHVVWQVEAARATVNLQTRPCESDDYPVSVADPGAPIDPISVSAPNSAALASAVADRPPVTPAAPPTSGTGQVQQAFTGPVPFTLRLTTLYVGPDGTNNWDVDARVTLDGSTSETHLWDCGGIGEGCIIAPIALDKRFTTTPANPELVSVRIRVIERDLFGDDEEVDVSFTVNPQTGENSWGADCAIAGDGWGICWDFFLTQPPPITDFQPTICARFNADFYDSGLGEDLLPGREEQQVPSSFAFAQLATSWDTVPVWTGYLDESGCIPQGTPETSQVLASVLAFPEGSDASVSLTFLPTFCRAAEGQTLPSVPGSPDDCAALVADGAIRWDVIEVTSGFSVVLGPNSELLVGETNVSNKTLQIPAFSGSLNPEAGSIVNGWIFPAVVNLVADQSAQDNLPRLDDVSRVAAVSSQILKTADSGIVPSAYEVFANDSCPTNNPDIVGDACVSGGRLWMGTGKLGFFNENFLQTKWKYVTAHEAGHMIQGRALNGSPRSTGYEFANTPPGCPPENQVMTATGSIVCADPQGTDAMCRCDHVESANKLHCLQSLERTGAAQGEGFAQFYAAKIFNQRSESDCTFVYYKEFVDQTCRSEECINWTPAAPSQFAQLIRSQPPLAVGCADPPRWRNNFCGVADFGTELDWMAFYWQLHAGPGAGDLFSMGDIYGVYTTACGGACNADEPWDDLQDAANTLFGVGSPRADRFAGSGETAGVSLNVAP